jgi:hypothetical protein
MHEQIANKTFKYLALFEEFTASELLNLTIQFRRHGWAVDLSLPRTDLPRESPRRRPTKKFELTPKAPTDALVPVARDFHFKLPLGSSTTTPHLI